MTVTWGGRGFDGGDRRVRPVANPTGREEPTAFHPFDAHDRLRLPPPSAIPPG
jgi:hypothetical protein